jgi:hypothetical protein
MANIHQKLCTITDLPIETIGMIPDPLPELESLFAIILTCCRLRAGFPFAGTRRSLYLVFRNNIRTAFKLHRIVKAVAFSGKSLII